MTDSEHMGGGIEGPIESIYSVGDKRVSRMRRCLQLEKEGQ